MGVIFKFKPFKTPYRWIFVDPDTQRFYSARTKKELFEQIVNYRSQNNLDPIQGLEHVIEHYLCTLPENTGNCESEKLRRGWLTTLKGGISLLQNVFYGEKAMVDQAIADQRSATCKTCPHNIFPDKGAFIQWSDELAEASTGGRKSQHHDSLGNCEACSCPLRAKVFYAGPFNLPDNQNKELPDFCWQKNK